MRHAGRAHRGLNVVVRHGFRAPVFEENVGVALWITATGSSRPRMARDFSENRRLTFRRRVGIRRSSAAGTHQLLSPTAFGASGVWVSAWIWSVRLEGLVAGQALCGFSRTHGVAFLWTGLWRGDLLDPGKTFVCVSARWMVFVLFDNQDGRKRNADGRVLADPEEMLERVFL